MNRDHVKRDEMLRAYFDRPEYSGGTCHFSRIPKELLAKLVKQEFADPEEQQNESPTIAEFLELEYDGILFDGYVVEIYRHDYRVSIDGIYVPHSGMLDKKTIELIQELHSADDFQIDDKEVYAWWD